MALIRDLAALLLAALLVAGCEQSLFGTPGDEDGGVAPDARDVGGDGGVDGGDVTRPDGGDGTDGGVPPDVCPDPCISDAVADFVYDEGAASSSWVYVQDVGGPLGTDYSEMRLATRDGHQVYVGGAGELSDPAIVSCAATPEYPGCAGVEDKLLLEIATAGNAAPALIWPVPTDDPARTYRVSGTWRVPPGAPTNLPMRLLLVRNSRFDTVLDESFLSSAEPRRFDLEVDVQPGDFLRLVVLAESPVRVPLAISFYVSGAQEPSQCQVTSFFEEDAAMAPLQFPNRCAETVFQDQSSDGAETTSNPAPSGIPGFARGFVDGSEIVHAAPALDYSGDFTVQFWALLQAQGPDIPETLVSDHDCAAKRGIHVYRDRTDFASSVVTFDVYFDDPGIDCDTTPMSITPSVSSGAWHLFRITRSMERGVVSVCVDGAYAGEQAVPEDADISGNQPLRLGRDASAEAPHFLGAFADLRVFSVALPCPAP